MYNVHLFRAKLHKPKKSRVIHLCQMRQNQVGYVSKQLLRGLFVFVCFVALRPKSTAMVIAGRSVHQVMFRSDETPKRKSMNNSKELQLMGWIQESFDRGVGMRVPSPTEKKI